jgi:ATP-dependent exoDNAse (exonuclease V) beta subunit
VNLWANYINSSGLTAITRNECLGQKKIFRVIYSILNFISNPFNNFCVAEAYQTLSECGIFKLHLDKIIESYSDNNQDFISLNNDEIKDSDLARFHWDMNYWLSFPELPTDELAMRIGLHYFSDSLEKSNIHLIATLCAKLDRGNFNQTVEQLKILSEKPSLSGFKFFSEEDETNLTGGKIQIMTLHKSKGDEFDYVFLPEMSERNLTLDLDKLKLKKSSDFTENIKGLNPNYKEKTKEELKEFLVSENYRLLYVAITRAKQRLYISASTKETFFGKERNSQPSIIFDELLQN